MACSAWTATSRLWHELAALATQHNAWFLVDDAHGLGVLGARGRGSLELAGLDAQQVPLLVGTLGKALGSFGAFVAGPADLVELVMQRARSYIFTTALPAPVAAATRAALRIVDGDSGPRERVQALTTRFRNGAAQLGLPLSESVTPIQPLLLGDAGRCLAASQALMERGYLGGCDPQSHRPGGHGTPAHQPQRRAPRSAMWMDCSMRCKPCWQTWPQPARIVNTTLYCERQHVAAGAAPLVCMHGWGMNLRAFDPLARCAARRTSQLGAGPARPWSQ